MWPHLKLNVTDLMLKMKPRKQRIRTLQETSQEKCRFKVCWLILCLIGNIYSVHQISCQYFRFGINTYVQVEVDDILELPTVNLCFDVTHLIRWEKLSPEQRHRLLSDDDGNSIFQKEDYDIDNETQESIEQLPITVRDAREIIERIPITKQLQSLNISEMFATTLNYSEVFTYVMQYMNDTNSYFPFPMNSGQFRTMYKVSTFFKDIVKCYSFEPRDGFKTVNYYDVMRQAVTGSLTSYFRLRLGFGNRTNKLYYLLSENGKHVYFGFTTALPITLEEKFAYAVTYDTYETTRLKKPFESRCIDYNEFGLESRGECYESCMRERVIQEIDMLPVGVSIFPEENRTSKIVNIEDFLCDNPASDDYGDEGLRHLHNRINRQCSEKCKELECRSRLFMPKLLNSMKTKQSTGIGNLLHFSPIIRAACQPALSLTQYLIDAASNFGFWMGISASGFFDYMKTGLTSFLSVFHQTPKQIVKQKKRPVFLKCRINPANTKLLRLSRGPKTQTFGIGPKRSKHKTKDRVNIYQPTTLTNIANGCGNKK